MTFYQLTMFKAANYNTSLLLLNDQDGAELTSYYIYTVFRERERVREREREREDYYAIYFIL